MQHQSIENAIARTLQALTSTGPVLKGSVSKVTLGKKVRSQGDRISYLLTYKGEGNITRSLYIPKDRLAEVKLMIRDYRKLKVTLSRLLDLNVKLFKARHMQTNQRTSPLSASK